MIFSDSTCRRTILILFGLILGLLIPALAPTLLQQAFLVQDRREMVRVRLTPLQEEKMLETRVDESDLELPPEPEVFQDLPEIEPPEMQAAEVEPAPDAYDYAAQNLNSLHVPNITVPRFKAVPVTTAAVSGPPLKVPLPDLPKHGASQVRFNSDEVDKQPQGIATMQPLYPYRAKRLGIEGKVHIRFLVDRSGKISLLKILKSSPAGEFDKAVKKTVQRWKFKPAMKDGRTVETWVETTILFKLS